MAAGGAVAAAAVRECGLPEPTAEDVQTFLDLEDRLYRYLCVAGEAWARATGDAAAGKPLDVSAISASTIHFTYYWDSREAADGAVSWLEVPTAALLPQFTQQRAVLDGLRTGPVLPPLP